MSRTEIKQVLQNWIQKATSPVGHLSEEFEPSDWIADNFIAWWRDEVNDALGSAELAACRLRNELSNGQSAMALDDALHEITHVQDALSDLRERLGLAAD